MNVQYLLGVLAFVASLRMVGANEQVHCSPGVDDRFVIEKLTIAPQPIFDLTAPDALALHRVANALHITTRADIIRERLSFREGDTVSHDDIQEAEALLRDVRYLANADIRVVHTCGQDKLTEVIVTTYDNWSLVPTFSFSRSGGENRLIAGIREDNLLGWGVRTAVRYNSNDQRSGLEWSIASAVHWVEHANVELAVADNDDGKQYRFLYEKPFYHLASTRYQQLSYGYDRRIDTVYQNGSIRNRLSVFERDATVAVGVAVYASETHTSRLIVGVSAQDASFSFAHNSPLTSPVLLPQNRRFRYPWLAFAYSQRHMVEKQNIHLINQPEDINLGWQYQLRVGLETNDIGNNGKFGYHLDAAVSTAVELTDGLITFNSDARAIINTSSDDYLQLSSLVQGFFPITEVLRGYTRLHIEVSSGGLLDQPIVIDDDNGVRGYPTQYQHGDHRWSASLEARFYSEKTYYQILNLGFAAYVDVGRAFRGAIAKFNDDPSLLASIGVGTRFYSNKASRQGVIHLDITRPLSGHPDVDSLAWGLTFRRTF